MLLKVANVSNKHYKTVLVHLAMLTAILLYLLFGAFAFSHLEASDSQSFVNTSVIGKDGKTIRDRENWRFRESLLFGFTIVTTIGYGNIAPKTSGGRIFCVLYACIGIPLVMLFVASLGQHVESGLYALCGRLLRPWRRKDERSATDASAEEDVEEEFSGFAKACLVLVATLAYVAFGSLVMSLYEGDKTPLDAFYFNFITLTTIGLGDFVPETTDFMPLTLAYILFGLTLTMMAINVASEYLKKLHYLGVKLQNIASTKIWFGSKTMSVKKLVRTMGRRFDISQETLDRIDLDDMVCEVLTPPGRTREPSVMWRFIKEHVHSPKGCNGVAQVEQPEPLLAPVAEEEQSDVTSKGTPPRRVSRKLRRAATLPPIPTPDPIAVATSERATMTDKRVLTLTDIEHVSMFLGRRL